MYSLMVVLSLLTCAAFLHIYVYRRRNYLPAFALLLAAMLYTHGWGIFVAAGTLVAAGVPLLASEDRRALAKDLAIGFGAAGLLYLPWLPTLLYQTAHTGAPWLNAPRFGAPIQITKSLLGGGTVTVAILLAGGSGLAGVIAARNRGRDRDRTAVYTALAVGTATLAIAWFFSQVSPAWTTRYLGVALGPIFLLASWGLARAGNLGLVALVIILGIWAIPKTSSLENKSNITDLAAAVDGELGSGDLVVTLQPEQHPLVRYSLSGDFRQATELGPVEKAGVMDWRDAQDRLEAATPEENLEPLLDSVAPSSRVMLVHPVTSDIQSWDAPWTRLVRRRAAQWGQAMERDERFTRESAVPSFYRRAGRIGVRGVLYRKTG